MYKIVVSFFFLFPSYLNAQTINATTQNSAGNFGISSNGYSLSYSVGESASIEHYVSSNNYILSTGFFQSVIPLVTKLNDLELLEGMALTIYPNPTVQYFQINANFNKNGIVYLQLRDVASKLRYSSEPITVFNQFKKRLDISEYAPGIYYLRIQFQPLMGQISSGLYKVVKL